MWKIILKLKRLLTWVLEQAVILIVAALVLDVLWGVGTRFVLGAPSRWTEEVATLLLIWVTLLGAAVGFIRHEHLGVDYLVKKLDPSAQKLLAIVAQLVTIAFTSSVLIYGGYVLVAGTLQSGQVTPALGIKMGYVYLAVPLGGLFIVLFCVENIAEIITGRSSPDEQANDPAATGEAI